MSFIVHFDCVQYKKIGVHKFLVDVIRPLFTALLYFLLNRHLMRFLKMDSRSLFKPGTCFTAMTRNGILRPYVSFASRNPSPTTFFMHPLLLQIFAIDFSEMLVIA